MASSTQRWSDNTFVCILPPRPTSGVVAVWFNGIQKDEDGTPPCLFTYTDESDRALLVFFFLIYIFRPYSSLRPQDGINASGRLPLNDKSTRRFAERCH